MFKKGHKPVNTESMVATRKAKGNFSWSEESKRKASLSHAGRPKSIEWRKSMSGKGNGRWIDGRSFLPYPKEFNASLKLRIKERDGFKCRLCHKTISLSIHHVDYNKNNCEVWNLITLCVSHNSRVNSLREYWKHVLLPMPYNLSMVFIHTLIH